MKTLTTDSSKFLLILKNPFIYLAIISIGLLVFEWKVIAQSPQKSGTDFSIYYKAAEDFKINSNALYTDAAAGFDQYLYPPPSLLIFLTFSDLEEHTSYLLFIIVMYACLIVSLVLLRNLCNDAGLYISKFEGALLIIFVLATGPVYHNIRLGQINAVVLLASILYLFMYKKRPVVAGLFLALAIWIKIYPVFLLLLAVLSAEGRRSILGCIMGGLIIPILLSPWLPFNLYIAFFEKLLDVSKYASMHIINHSLIAFGLRFYHPFEWAFKWPNIYLIPEWLKAVNYALMVIVMGISIIMFKRIKLRTETHKGELIVAAILLSLSAVFSPLGWGHTFILAMPLMLVGFKCLEQISNKWIFLFIVSLVAMLSLIPVYNDKLFLAPWPLVIRNFYYSRLLWITLLLIGIVLVYIRKRMIRPNL